MPRTTGPPPPDGEVIQPRRSVRAVAREQAILDKESKKAKEDIILAKLPAGQKYFYLTPDGQPVLERDAPQVATIQADTPENQPQPLDFGDQEDRHSDQWIEVGRTRNTKRKYGTNNKAAKTTSVKAGSVAVRPSVTPRSPTTPTQSQRASSPTPPATSRRPGNGQPTYAEAVNPASSAHTAPTSKRPRADSTAMSTTAEDIPPAKKPRIPPVTASRRAELSSAAEQRSRAALSERKTTAHGQLASTASKPPLSTRNISSASHTSWDDRPSPLVGPPRAYRPSTVSTEQVGSKTSQPPVEAQSLRTAHEMQKRKAQRKAMLLTEPDAPIDIAVPAASLVTQAKSLLRQEERADSYPVDFRLTPSPVPTPQSGSLPFSNGWENYDSEEDRQVWGNPANSSRPVPFTRSSSPEVPLQSHRRVQGLPPPMSNPPRREPSDRSAAPVATRLPCAQLPHDALRRSTDPLYAEMPSSHVGPVVNRTKVQTLQSTGTSLTANMPSTSRSIGGTPMSKEAERLYVEDIQDEEEVSATAGDQGDGLAPARRYRHRSFFPEPSTVGDLHGLLIRPDPYPTKKGGLKGYLYPALKYSPATVDGAEELLAFKNSMPRDYDCLDEPLSKPVAAKRRPQLVRSMFRGGQHLSEIGPSIVLALHMQLDGASGIDVWTNPHTRFYLPGLVDDVAKMVHERTSGTRVGMSETPAATTTRAVRIAQKALEEQESGALIRWNPDERIGEGLDTGDTSE